MRWTLLNRTTLALSVVVALSSCTVEVNVQDKRVTQEAVQSALDKVSEHINAQNEAIKKIALTVNELKSAKGK